MVGWRLIGYTAECDITLGSAITKRAQLVGMDATEADVYRKIMEQSLVND